MASPPGQSSAHEDERGERAIDVAAGTPLLLGVDVGTTLCKAGLVTSDGRDLGVARVATPWQQVKTGAEIDPEALFATVLEAARQAIAAASGGAVVGVGITSMAETGVLIDAANRPLTRALAWFDTRGGAEEAALVHALGRATFASHTGLGDLRLTSLVKLCWLLTHEPAVGRARHWLNVAEWIAFRLGAEPVAELSLASRTGLLDQHTQTWWPDAFAWARVSEDLMPRLVRAGTPVGHVRRGLLPRADGAVLSIAGHDHLCASIGAGACLRGDVLNSCGTATAFVRGVPGRLSPEAMQRMVARRISVGTHVIPGQQALLAGFAAGAALNRFLQLLGVDERGRAALDAEAAVADVRDLRVHGIDSPSATLSGIDTDITPGRVWRAALEAVERRLAEILDVMAAEAGPHRRLVVVGGWARSPAIQTAKRAVLGPFVYPHLEEAGVRGAALLAGQAAGCLRNVEDVPPGSLSIWITKPVGTSATGYDPAADLR